MPSKRQASGRLSATTTGKQQQQQQQDFPPKSKPVSPLLPSSQHPFDFGGLLEDHDDKGGSKKEQQLLQQTRGVYGIYKQATEAFRDGLAQVLPKKFRLSSMTDYKRAADWILEKSAAVADAYESSHAASFQKAQRYHHDASSLEQNQQSATSYKLIVVDQSVFDNLNTSIRHRQDQMRKHGDNDKGHGYIISVLGYCREVLLYSNNIAKCIHQHQQYQQQHRTKTNQTTSLDVWDLSTSSYHDRDKHKCKTSEEENVGDEPSFVLPSFSSPPAPPPPSSPSSSSRYGHEDLINADDRFQCIALLETMDRLMGVIRNRFDEVKRICVENNIHITNSNASKNDSQQQQQRQQLFYALMEASIATTLCMECVQSTWAELTLEHSHIRSVYDLLAVVFVLPILSVDNQHYVDLLTYQHKRHPHMVTHFVADVIEACFAVDGFDFTKALQSLASRSCLTDGGWEKELLLDDAQKLAREIAHGIVLEPSSHKIRKSFLYGYKFIGGRRCILNTLKVLQQAFAFVHATPSGKGKSDTPQELPQHLLARAGENTFQVAWHEDTHPARNVQCLDRLLASEILPELIAACNDQSGLPIHSNPGVKRFVPLLHSLDNYLTNGLGTPVPIHLTFGFHAMLISIMALEGNEHLERLGCSAQYLYNDYFTKSQAFHQNDEGHVWFLSVISHVAMPTWSPISPPTSQRNAFWNPFMAGSFCLYAVYTGMLYGTSFVREDRVRPVMHLYNALKCCNLLDDESIEVLELLDNILSTSPAIWFAGRTVVARPGDFAKNFLLGTGLAIRDVSVVLGGLKMENGVQVCRKRYRNDRNKSMSFAMNMVAILRPKDFSMATRALFWRDYSDFSTDDDHVVKYDWNNSTCFDLGNDVGDVTECEVLIAKACMALRADIKLFGGSFIDLAAASLLFEGFSDLVGKELQWEDGAGWTNIVDILGELDFAPNAKLTQAPIIARLMKQHFGAIRRNQYAFSNGL